MPKAELRSFLSRNPFPRPLTHGFFYREKMRAIHRIAPDRDKACILELGGGTSGLSLLLYPDASVTNVDIDPTAAAAPTHAAGGTAFAVADCTRLPFPDRTFDIVTAFDLLEHVEQDGLAVQEAIRVLKPEGAMLVTAPNERWRYPYYPILQPICPRDTELMARWGHVRRGYAVHELETLFGRPCQGSATFISPITAIGHDLMFSTLPALAKDALACLLMPMTWASYARHGPDDPGTETATRW